MEKTETLSVFSEATAVLLAGGTSRRMGSDKALIPMAGQPLVQGIADELQQRFQHVLLSVQHPGDYDFLGLSQVVDRLPGAGPLAALASALSGASQPHCFLISCDVPEIPWALVSRMWSVLDAGAEAVIPLTAGGRLQPLFAWYRSEVAPKLLHAVDRGERRMGAVIDLLDVVQLQAGDVSLTNLNTPEDLRAYLSR